MAKHTDDASGSSKGTSSVKEKEFGSLLLACLVRVFISIKVIMKKTFRVWRCVVAERVVVVGHLK